MDRLSRRTRPVMWALIVVGAIALFGGISAGIDGFVGGMLQGAGFAVAVTGAYFLGTLHGAGEAVAEGAEPAVWLPSRDGGR